MTFAPVDPRVEAYLRELGNRHDEPVLLEMEALAQERSFPIVGRLVGELLLLLGRSVGARTVFELGSGFGFSAYWFTLAVGPEGRVICTDGDAANRDAAQRFLERTGRWDQIDYHVGEAQAALRTTEGQFDIIYNDIDKQDYPAAWELAKDRIKPGGLYICDNVLWSGRVAEPDKDDERPETTEAIRRHNQLVMDDPAFDATIIPTRDGVIVARHRA